MSRNHVRLNARRWAATRRRVFERSGYRCQRCGRAAKLEADHIRRLEDGGFDPYDESNLQSLCRTCHIAKTAEENRAERTPEQAAWDAFLQELVDAG
ncbi:MAG: HNH endonuclease signature motif containing protein [Alphaproteobacteria bacterium]|nr:HNH endonuclease signature motif containing protein [Alphaproteobacteria bacterium]